MPKARDQKVGGRLEMPVIKTDWGQGPFGGGVHPLVRMNDLVYVRPCATCLLPRDPIRSRRASHR